MHLTTTELIELRNNGTAHPHLAGCFGCRDRLARLHLVREELQALDDPAPDEALWQLIRLEARSDRRWIRHALAATLLVGIGLLSVLTLQRQQDAEALIALMARSNRLENEIRLLQPTVPVGLVPRLLGTRAEIARLDAEIQAAAAADPERLDELWAERVRLLQKLKTLYQSETREVTL